MHWLIIFDWSKECDSAFRIILDILFSHPVLAYLCSQRHFVYKRMPQDMQSVLQYCHNSRIELNECIHLCHFEVVEKGYFVNIWQGI